MISVTFSSFLSIFLFVLRNRYTDESRFLKRSNENKLFLSISNPIQSVNLLLASVEQVCPKSSPPAVCRPR